MNGVLNNAAVKTALHSIIDSEGSRLNAAKRLNVGYATVTKWLGGYSVPSYIHAVRIARVAGVDMDSLYVEEVAA